MADQETLTFPPSLAAPFTPYLPPPSSSLSPYASSYLLPFVTLTFATSLDSSLSLSPGVRTTLSGPLSKSMTHHLRAHHASILIGAGTAIADDPGLNCRIASSVSPRPIVLDPRARWAVTAESKVIRLAGAGQGLAPFILVSQDVKVPAEREEVLRGVGGRYIRLATADNKFAWRDVLRVIRANGLGSVMVEGGGDVINSLLRAPDNELVRSVIVTIAPTWLGKGGVVVSPERTTDADGQPAPPIRLTNIKWIPLGEDVVVCGEILRP
ncbi:2,5-diamino-6--4-pyrimidinone 5'-phosphate reductase [Echria macrotheca]|uniref:2,5-diamino-6-ribosylamino-4(3H)-pyrimidinone 5'-phosphate reductase n=1 Tax=Echria macrotheca TaxID=438768 RepID=A0AAJ0BK20_9PEZI|nr:2,5-diamino-6--4-pyrimidinone 5'-phosphate reductase [Echria macrotheca]